MLHYQPDPLGDLAYNGVAANVLRKNEATGLQFDLSAVLNPQHTLRAGLFAQHERGSGRQQLARVPGRCRRQPDQRHADLDHRRREAGRPPVRHLRARRMAADEGV